MTPFAQEMRFPGKPVRFKQTRERRIPQMGMSLGSCHKADASPATLAEETPSEFAYRLLLRRYKF